MLHAQCTYQMDKVRMNNQYKEIEGHIEVLKDPFTGESQIKSVRMNGLRI